MLDPLFTFVPSVDCTTLTITDTTVYGTPNEDRVDVTVDFTVILHKEEGDEDVTPTYDPTTVVSIVLDDPEDGWYEVTMDIKDAVTPFALIVSKNEDFILKCSALKCLNEKILEWAESRACGCPDKELFCQIQEIRNLLAGSDYKCDPSADLPGSRDLLDQATELCLCQDCGSKSCCGC